MAGREAGKKKKIQMNTVQRMVTTLQKKPTGIERRKALSRGRKTSDRLCQRSKAAGTENENCNSIAEQPKKELNAKYVSISLYQG